ncbi:MAG: type II toxin-antitoxin system VapC family toxin [Pyrinomonadaceae bacterium]
MSIIIVDSDILIDFNRGQDIAVEWLEAASVRSVLSISQMTEMELVVGSRNKEHFREIKQLLNRFDLININDQISILASELIDKYCLSHGLRIPDAVIAATALVLDESLATGNQRDFKFIEGLRLIDYP